MFIPSSKKKQQEKLEATNYQMQIKKEENRQVILSVEQVLREFGLLRFAKTNEFNLETITSYQSALLIYIAIRNNITKKMRKEYLEDTIVELASEDHLLLIQ